jgi:HlyD family secretion protein
MTRRAAWTLPLLLACGCGEPDEPGVVRLNGRIEAVSVDLAPKISGRVLEVSVVEGQRVQAGQRLVLLDLGTVSLDVARERAALAAAQARLADLERGSRDAEIAAARAQLDQRSAALDLARANLTRQETLLAKKVGAQREYDEARAAFEQAEAVLEVAHNDLRLLEEGSRREQIQQARDEVARARTVLEQAQVQAAEAEIRAPAEGIVLHRLAEPGLLLAAGQSALTLAFADRLYVRVFVPETRLGQVRQGAPATVRVDAFPGEEFAGRVSEISPEAEFTPKAVETRRERVNLVYPAKVDLERGWEAPLVPGQPAEVRVPAQAAGE